MPSDPLLAAKSVSRHFAGLIAVDRVSLAVEPASVHALIGPNGAGKSTLVNLLAGELAASEGTVVLDGRDVTRWPQPQRSRAGIGRTYQRTTIFPRFSVHVNCRLAAQAHRQEPWRLWARASDDRGTGERAEAAIELTGLASSTARVAGTLAHGQKRQLEIAMCLATAPRVLLLDEPLAGMGAAESEQMLGLIDRLKPTHGILLVEHDMDAVFRIADWITVLANGAVVASDVPATIRANAEVQAAYLGEPA